MNGTLQIAVTQEIGVAERPGILDWSDEETGPENTQKEPEKNPK